MPSNALADWRGRRCRRLANIWAVHDGLPLSWQQEQAELLLVVKMAAEFQGFSRDLHDLSIDFLADSASQGNMELKVALKAGITSDRGLNRNNAGPDTLEKDFLRIGLKFWQYVESAGQVARGWRGDLRAMMDARNSIAHDDEERLLKLRASGLVIDVKQVKAWQSSLDGLAATMDDVVSGYLGGMMGVPRPW